MFSLFIQFLSGHTFWQRHLTLVGLEDDATCRICGEQEETPKHLYMECSGLDHVRERSSFETLVEEDKIHYINDFPNIPLDIGVVSQIILSDPFQRYINHSLSHFLVPSVDSGARDDEGRDG